MKKYNGLLMAFLVGFSVSLIASEDTKKSFVESTKEDLAIGSILYATVYASATIVGNCFWVPFVGLIEASIERGQARENGQKISFKKTANTFAKELKDEFLMNKGIIRSHRVAAPVVLGGIVANNLYKQAHS